MANINGIGIISNIGDQELSGSLNIVGNSPTFTFKIETSGSTNSILVDSDGKVGINNATPSYNLDVTGNFKVSNGLIIGLTDITTSWSTYSVSWTSTGLNQPSIGDGTLTGYYKIIGKTTFVRVRFVWGTTTDGGDGDWLFSLPVTAIDKFSVQLPCILNDGGLSWEVGTASTNLANLNSAVSIFSRGSGVNSMNPFIWTTNGDLNFEGSYESA